MRMLRTPRTTDQFTQIIETAVLGDILSNNPANTYITSTAGALFPRTTAMSKLFQQQRIVQVVFTYEPLYNVFQGTMTPMVGTSIPDFYYLMDRQGAYSASAIPTNLTGLISGGARPKKFTKNITIKYKPNTLGVTSQAPAGNFAPLAPTIVATDIQYDKWFQTSAVTAAGTLAVQSINYYGHLIYISQENSAANPAPVSRCNLTIVTQFKQPFYPTS